MSEECCGPDEPKTITPKPAAQPVTPVLDGDACCGPELPPVFTKAQQGEAEHAVRPPWWRDPVLLPSALSGIALAIGYLFE